MLRAAQTRSDDVRVVVLRGAGGRAFVAGTDISQFLDFSTGEDGLRYEAEIDRVVGRLETVRVPTIALVDGVAMGSGVLLAATCDLRDLHARGPLRRADRAHGRQLPVDGQLRRLVALLGEARVKQAIFTAADIDGLATEVVDDAEARVEELCAFLASHAAVTMRVDQGGAAAAATAPGRRRPRPRGLRERGVQGPGASVPAAMTDAIVCRKRASPSTSRGRNPVGAPPSRSACSARRISAAAFFGVRV